MKGALQESADSGIAECQNQKKAPTSIKQCIINQNCRKSLMSKLPAQIQTSVPNLFH